VEVSGAGDGLSAAAFEKLLALLHPDRERAGEIYVSLRAKLVRLFEWRGAELPENLADETLNRVAHNVHKEYLRDHFKKVDAIESGELERRYPVVQEEVEEPRLDCLRRCLDRLSPEERQLLLDYHGAEDRIRVRQRLAESFGNSLNALRIKVHRLRQKVEECLADCLGV
jgi:hypothetical protein